MEIIIFDDIYSLIHFLLGIIAVIFNIDISLTLLFIGYQLIEREVEEEKLGDIIEYAVGLIMGAIIKTTLVVQ